MIYPTRRAIVVAVAGAPFALAIGVLAPQLWPAGLLWILAALGLLLLDAGLGASRRRVEVHVAAPSDVGVGGGPEPLTVQASFGARRPTQVEIALEVDERLTVAPARVWTRIEADAAQAAFSLTGVRRGQAWLHRLWIRWPGPLGLAWKQRTFDLETSIPVTNDIRGLKQAAVRLFAREALFGAKVQVEIGEGAEFNALKEYMPGMDLRAVDWKQSARHGSLMVKEYRTERNHPVVLALDSGRLMCEPVDGLPRMDHALNAALLLGFVSLKIGDRVSLYAFDSRPRVSTGAVAGARGFPALQRRSAEIDYSTEETNFTLGLTTLQGELERRSLVVMFTDFADPTSAELMLENVGRLLKRHFVLFVVFADAELEALVSAPPRTPEDVSRAVVAAAMLRERELVVRRLRRLGADIVEAPAAGLGGALLERYLQLKRGGRL